MFFPATRSLEARENFGEFSYCGYKVKRQKRTGEKNILKSKKFKNRVDLIRVILQDNESYTLEEVQKEIDKFMKRRVN